MDAESVDLLVAKVLKEELREDENSRKQGLEQFREWILKNPDIRDCITDDSFLLPFLRVRKYSVPMAEQTLMNLLKFQHNFPSLHSNLDIEDTELNDIISSGYQFVTPIQNSKGRFTVMSILKNLDLNKYGYQQPLRVAMLNCMTMVLDESTQTLGIDFICDYSQVSPAFITLFPVAVLMAVVDSFQKAIPLRFKATHIINAPPYANWLIKTILSLLSEKLRGRTHIHSSMEELHKHVDPSVLPKEYGGTMPMEEMIGLWKKKMAVNRGTILAVNNIKLVGDSFKNNFGCGESGNLDMSGSFRKLQVD